jgi:hypothetical protein
MKHFYILKNVESSDQVGVMVYGTLLVSMDLMDPFFFFFPL